MLDDLKLLNEEFFILYGRLYHNLELISEKQYSFMADKLFEQYKTEYTKLAIEKEIDDKTVLKALKMRFGGYVPRRSFFFFKNTAFKLLKKQINKELDEYFTSNFNKLKEILPVEEPGVVPTEEPAKDNKGKK